jgi:hypothetical protein
MRWLGFLLLATLPASAEQITCRDAGDQVVLSLNDRVMNGVPFDCIRGSFLGPSNYPCAPNGAFSLYDRAGNFQTTTQRSDYMGHDGSVIGHFADSNIVTFTGGAGGTSGYQQYWRFTLDRSNSTAELARPNRLPVHMRCNE